MQTLLTSEEVEWLAQHGNLSVGAPENLPPLQMVDSKGRFVGVAGDYIELIQKRLGASFHILPMPTWGQLLDKAGRGEVDIVVSVIETRERQSFLDFTDVLYELPQVIVSQEKRADIRGIQDLIGKKVAVVAGTRFQEWLRTEYPGVTIVPQADADQCMQSLATEQADAYVGDLSTAAYAISRLGIAGLRVVSEVGSPTQLRIGIRKGLPQLVAILNKAISSITPEEHRTIRNRWLAVGQPSVDVRRLLRILLPVLAALIVLILLASNWRLQREIRNRLHAEGEAKESGRMLEKAQAIAHVGSYRWDFTTQRVTLSAEMDRIFGFAPGSFDGTLGTLVNTVYPSDRAMVEAKIDTILREGRSVTAEFRILLPDGTERVLWEDGEVIKDVKGKAIGLNGILQDITQRKADEEDLRRHKFHLEELVEERTEQLARSEEWARTIIDVMADGVVIIGEDGHIDTVNAAMSRLLGWSKQELVGKDFIFLLPETDQARVRDRRKQRGTMMDADPALEIQEINMLRKDGSMLPTEFVRQAFRSQKGRHTVVSLRDVSERKRNEETLRRYANEVSDLYNNAPCGYHSLSDDGTFLRVNDTELRWLGFTREEMVGRMNIEDVLTEESKKTFAASIPLFMQEGYVSNLEVGLYRKDGSELSVLLSATGVKDARGMYLMSRSTIFDNTEKKRLIEQLEVAKKAAEEANRAKSSFLANMSHEIRTPMNAVIGFANLALRTTLSTQQRDYMSKIHNAGISLLGLINDILDFSKIEAGRLTIEQVSFSLESVIAGVTSYTSQNAFSKGLELLVYVPADIPQDLLGDAHRLGQVLTNLVGNAVKFTEAGEIELKASLVERTGDKVKLRFSVRDTGIGMTEEQITRLFQPFSQANDSTTRKYGGTGLGLSITRRLVELMGGQIWVDTVPRTGSTFAFTAWFGVGTKGDEKRRPLPRKLEGMRVLIADDNQAARDIMQEILSSLRFRVEAVGSGEEALEAVRRADGNDPFGLVLMDWKMPGLNGIEATRRILAGDHLRNAPVVIVLSASDGTDGQRPNALEAGAAEFLPKPLTPSTLVDAILKIYAPEILPALKEMAQTSESSHALQGARVLLVEDNEINQQIAGELLQAAGVIVEVANNGREAVEKLDAGNRKFDMVLMDIQMPEMDGYEATRRIRAEEWGHGLPIIAMTAHALVEERQNALRAGMDDHIIKPIDPEAMFETMGRYYRRTASQGHEPAADRGEEGLVNPVIEGIDTKSGLRRVAGNHALYADLLRRFADGQHAASEKVMNALAQGDVELAERIAHTVKGISGNLGATEVQSTAGELERRIQGKEPRDLVEQSVRLFASAMESATSRILAALPVAVAAAGISGIADRGELKAIIGKLTQLVKESDGEAIDFLESVRGKLASGCPQEEIELLRENLRSYDFAAALATAELLERRVG